MELFTSEDGFRLSTSRRAVRTFGQVAAVAGAQLVVLSEHVDYWNHIGWRDPYSSHAYSERQGAYAVRFGLSSVYTPQMVVDGKFEFVGSDESRAIAAAEKALQAQKVSIKLSGAHMESDGVLTLHLDAGRLPPPTARPTNVLLAVVDERDETHVSSGENGGRTLRHMAVLRSLKVVGSVDQSKGLSKDVEVEVPRRTGSIRLVAFAQEEAGTIRGRRFDKAFLSDEGIAIHQVCQICQSCKGDRARL